MLVIKAQNMQSSISEINCKEDQYQRRKFLNILSQNCFTRKLIKENSSPLQIKILSQTRKIKPKMFAKVAGWMEKITKETLQFSFETLEMSFYIIINFLNKVDESPKNLQLLACVSLHIASKINEPKIVSIGSYMQCCMNIFNSATFEDKQVQVYQVLQHKIQRSKVHSLWNFIQDQFRVPEQKSIKWKNLINNLLKDPSFYLLRIQDIAIKLMIVCNDESQDLNGQNILEYIKNSQILP